MKTCVILVCQYHMDHLDNPAIDVAGWGIRTIPFSFLPHPMKCEDSNDLWRMKTRNIAYYIPRNYWSNLMPASEINQPVTDTAPVGWDVYLEYINLRMEMAILAAG